MAPQRQLPEGMLQCSTGSMRVIRVVVRIPVGVRKWVRRNGDVADLGIYLNQIAGREAEKLPCGSDLARNNDGMLLEFAFVLR